jgi:hypothetical protein
MMVPREQIVLYSSCDSRKLILAPERRLERMTEILVLVFRPFFPSHSSA